MPSLGDRTVPREETVRSLRDRTVDLLVIGGGIVGAGIARDAALRGLSVALIEQHDLASGTSSRPTRLIHGGLRYLELFDFGLVRSDMRERETLLRIAPHLVFPLAFLMPLYRRSPFYRLKLRVGMFLYDLLSLDKSLPKRRRLGRAETLAAEPNLDPDGLGGAWRFYDAQVPFVERLVVANALDAAAHGALILNHARATGYLRDGRLVSGASVHDAIAGSAIDVRARFTVNATGPWLDQTLAPLRPGLPPLLRLTKGTHLVVPRATAHAHVLFATRDRRLFFVLPWNGYTIVGTTDTDYRGDPEAVEASAEDVDYLRAEAARAFPSASFERIHFTWSGVRALVRDEGVAEGDVSRKHTLYDHRRDGIDGALSVVGGKITAYRSIAEEVTDLVARRLGSAARSRTSELPLPHAEDPAAATGDDALCPHATTTRADVQRAVQGEWAMTLGDVLLRRTAIGLAACQGLDRIETIAELVGGLLGWDLAQQTAEIAAYRGEIAPMRRFSTP